MYRLIEIDQAIEVAINGWHAPWADTFFWYVSQSWVWIPLYAWLIGMLLWRYGWRKALWMVLALVVAAGLSDWMTSGVIKPMMCRWRPTHEPALVGLIHVVNGYAGGNYGFVSSHAANTMAVAMLFSVIWKNNKATAALMAWVALNCYSRMYLGVHYLGDILGGLIIGVLVACGLYWVLHHVGMVQMASEDVAYDCPIECS